MLVSEDVLKQITEEVIPFHKFLNLQLLEYKEGYSKLLIPFREEVIGDPRSRRWHGGVIATAMDSAGGIIAMGTLKSPKEKVSTIDLRIDYLRGAGPTDLIVTGELVKSGNRVISAKMQAWQEDGQKLVAEGRAVFSVYRADQ